MGKFAFNVHHSKGINNEHQFVVEHEGKEIARARLSHTGEYAVDLGVHPDYRRKGVASSLYNHIESELGYKLKPSPVHQTEAGKSFWGNRKETE